MSEEPKKTPAPKKRPAPSGSICWRQTPPVTSRLAKPSPRKATPPPGPAGAADPAAAKAPEAPRWNYRFHRCPHRRRIAPGMIPMPRRRSSKAKRCQRTFHNGIANILANFRNNTQVTITDMQGNLLGCSPVPDGWVSRARARAPLLPPNRLPRTPLARPCPTACAKSKSASRVPDPGVNLPSVLLQAIGLEITVIKDVKPRSRTMAAAPCKKRRV